MDNAAFLHNRTNMSQPPTTSFVRKEAQTAYHGGATPPVAPGHKGAMHLTISTVMSGMGTGGNRFCLDVAYADKRGWTQQGACAFGR